jgi:formate transporter
MAANPDDPRPTGADTGEPSPYVPAAQYLEPERVIRELGEHGARRLRALSASRVLVLGVLAGAFITTGALFSALLAAGTDNPGIERLLEGFAFSSGFFFVILSGAALFTEANVVMPATALRHEPGLTAARIARFWALALAGNAIGSLLVAYALHLAQHYPADVTTLLDEIVDRKLAYRATGGTGAWFQIVGSGVLANWLVGMAAFFATMARTIVGKYIPVFLAVTTFVAANFQHSPANLAYFAIAESAGRGPGWDVALGWSVVPAGIGNIIGGSLLVVLPFCYQTWRPAAKLRP